MAPDYRVVCFDQSWFTLMIQFVTIDQTIVGQIHADLEKVYL